MTFTTLILCFGLMCFAAAVLGCLAYDVVSVRLRWWRSTRRAVRARPSPPLPPATPRQIERAFRLNRPDLRIVRERDGARADASSAAWPANKPDDRGAN